MTPPDREGTGTSREERALSQPPYYPPSGPQGGPYAPPAPVPPPSAAPPAAAPPPAAPQPAAPTQIAYPGQLQLPPQPQYAPSPQQAQAQQGPVATGFPNYRSPAPSPPRRTGVIVGFLVVLAVVIFAVVGFWLVA
jgi:hypothetical protein